MDRARRGLTGRVHNDPDGLIVDIALPSLSKELGPTTRELQWIVDSYLLVFTRTAPRRRRTERSLRSASGPSDRPRRVRGHLGVRRLGRHVGFADLARALMGIGAAAIFPTMLAIITNLFTNPKERSAAIGIWSAVSGMGVAAGPIAGGWLLEHFWWGSVFLVNIPVVIVAMFAVVLVVPQSRDRTVPSLDLPGLVLSIATIGALVFSIIEAPHFGWLDPVTLGGFAVTGALLVAFIWWELRVAHPLLPVRIFQNLRFSAASVAVTSAFFAVFGFVFLITQYFQLVRGYSPLSAGVRTLPVALSIAAASVFAPKLVGRIGTKRVVGGGLALMAIGFAWVSFASAKTPYLEIVGQMLCLGLGLGSTTAPATESIMGSLSVDKAGVGSAVNDTTRELGGTLGVAVIGSVFTSVYVQSLDRGPVFSALPMAARDASRESVVVATQVAGSLGANAQSFFGEVSNAFLSGQHAYWVAAAVALAGSIFALRFLPARADKAAAVVEKRRTNSVRARQIQMLRSGSKPLNPTAA